MWVDNFDEEFTKEEAINSYQPGTNMKIINEHNEDFKDFETKMKIWVKKKNKAFKKGNFNIIKF